MRKTKKEIIVGARASLLSLAQAKSVIKLLKSKFPRHSFCLKRITTFGDTQKKWQRLDTGIFVKELEEALLRKEIDLAVHSLKDLPCLLPKGLALAAVTKRMDPRDCIIFRDNKTTLSKLKKGARIGTSSLRRKAQLLYWRADLQVENLRGNLDTRLERLKKGGFDAIVVALAGIKRLGSKNLFTQIIPAKLILPAPAQGALGIEIRQDDRGAKALAEGLNDRKSFLCISAERAFLEALGAGCRLPLGALAKIKDAQIHLEAVVASCDGKRLIRLSKRASLKKLAFGQGFQPVSVVGKVLYTFPYHEKVKALGRQLARQMLKKGARKLLREA